LTQASKRALIVDDSKSARAFLSRILEHYHIEVDTADSAEHAIQYLGERRPDVIFMDHLMPGMDGFQAVRAIKNDPRTAAIPIMMYTSEEGELYLGQARALGAAGVLPKQIRPADVSRLLYELRLVPDRRADGPNLFKPVVIEASSKAKEAEVASPPRPLPASTLTESTLRDQFAELRRTLVASLDTHSERMAADLRFALQEAIRAMQPAKETPRRAWGWIAVACLASLGLVGCTALWWNEIQLRRSVEARISTLESSLAAATAAQRKLEIELLARTAAEVATPDPPAAHMTVEILPP
jgi:CheY-like chemotaxis protein